MWLRVAACGCVCLMAAYTCMHLLSIVELQRSYPRRRKVLGISNSLTEVGTIKWDLALCLLFAWLVILICIWNGIKTSGKVNKLILFLGQNTIRACDYRSSNNVEFGATMSNRTSLLNPSCDREQLISEVAVLLGKHFQYPLGDK